MIGAVKKNLMKKARCKKQYIDQMQKLRPKTIWREMIETIHRIVVHNASVDLRKLQTVLLEILMKAIYTLIIVELQMNQ